MKKLYLVDVSSMFFRAFYAVRPLTSPAGMPTNAIYGFISMIVKLLKEEKPDYIAFCYDRPEPSFRIEIDKEYKANRSETPAELIPQIPYIKKVVDVMGIPAFEQKGFEADDLIGTFAVRGLQEKLHVVIVSGDKDFGQLVTDHVVLYDTMKDSRTSTQGVIEKYGIRPDQFIDYLALIGDSSDNVPGVSGIGPKGAQKLLTDFHTLDGIYQNLESIKSDSVKEKLRVGKDSAYMSKKLVTIVTDVPLDVNIQDLTLKPAKRDELRALLRELNFKTFEKNLLGEETSATPSTSTVAPSPAPLPPSVPTMSNEDWIDRLEQKEVLPSDAPDFIKFGQSVWLIQNEREVALINGKQFLILRGSPEEWGPVLSERRLRWSGFNLKSFWRSWNIQNPICEWDSQLAAYVVTSAEVGDFKEVSEKFLQTTLPELASLQEELQLQIKLQKVLQQKLTEIESVKILEELEMPLSPILLKMELKGILLDEALLAEQNKGLTTDIHSLEKKIYEGFGEEFNIASPKQLAHILFDKLKLPPGKKTKTGYSTDTDVLEKLKDQHSAVELILQYRELAKLKSTYVESLPKLIDPKDGRIHSHFNQALTTTGRLSSTNPNLQNIPIKTERGAAIRKAFIAKPNHKLISLDYSQIELRILAHITSDEGLCEAFKSGLDIHTATASEIFGVATTAVDAGMRRTAKAVNFGIAYGQGAFGLAETLGVSRTESQEIIKKYFIKFPKVRDYMESVVVEAKEKGYVTTIFGRRRNMHELQSSNPMIRKFGERAAINAPIQGSAADVVKFAMIKASVVRDADLLLQVHDELIFEVATGLAEQKLIEIKKIMETVCDLKVPLVVNGSAGDNWDQAH